MWAEVIGVCLSLSSMIWIPVYAIYYVVVTPGSIKEVKFYFSLISSFDIDRSILFEFYMSKNLQFEFKDRRNVSEYSERFETEHKIASETTEGGEIGSDTNVGEQRRIDHEEQQFPQSNMIAVKIASLFLIRL